MLQAKRVGVAFVVTAGLLGGSLVSADAAPAPYVAKATIAVNKSNPSVGGRLRVLGAGFLPGENVIIDIHSKARRLARVTVNKKGKFKVRVQLPPRRRCQHDITAKGKTSKLNASTTITIGNPAFCD